MTRTFTKTTSDSPLKFTALCIAIALGWIVQGAPILAEEATLASAQMIFSHVC